MIAPEQKTRAVHFYDLDMTKPLFRSRDQREAISGQGVCFHYEEQFMDAPTQAGGVSRLLRDQNCYTVLDVGGDYIGARSVGGYAPLLNQPCTAVYYVINPYRPWSMTLEHINKILGQTLGVSHVQVDRLRLIGNPNLGPETTLDEVLSGAGMLQHLVGTHKPVEFLCVRDPIAAQAAKQLDTPILPLKLYLSYPWAEKE